MMQRLTGDLTLGQVVIKRVAVVELGVNNGSGDGGGCFGIEVWTDTALHEMLSLNLSTKCSRQVMGVFSWPGLLEAFKLELFQFYAAFQIRPGV